MRSIFALFAVCIFTGGLRAHNVIYRSLAGEIIQPQTILPPPPQPMTLAAGGADGTISVVHFPVDEHCLVTADANPAISANPLVSIINPTRTSTGLTASLDVIMTVHVNRDPSQPRLGASESVLISGTWAATGKTDNGSLEQCNGSGVITALVTVNAAAAPPMISFANIPFSGTISHPVSMATGELFGHDEVADLSLGGPLPLSFRRYYGSFLSSSGVSSSLGTNWMHNFDLKLSVSGSTARVTLFRGKTVTFTRSGAAWQLSSNELRPYQLAAAGAGFQFLSPVSNLIYTFDASGALTRVEDRNGNAFSVTQAAGGVGPSLVSDSLGRTLTFTYSGKNLTGVRDQSGRGVSYENSNGNLSAWTDANGKRATFAYTSAGSLSGLMTAETRPAGNRPFTQQFDAQGRVSSQSDSFSNTMSIAYSQTGATATHASGTTFTQAHDTQHNLAGQSDPSGASSQYSYDAKGHPMGVTDRLGARSSATWDAASGLPASYTDELGNTTSFTYTATTQGGFTFYDLTGVRFADGASVSLARDAKGNVLALTDASGQKWQATWNARGQIATATNPSGGVTTFSYGQDGTLSGVQLASGDSTRIGYDAVRRPNLVTRPDGATRSLQYDADDNPLRVTDERGASSAASYDDNNNLRSATDALAAVTSLSYDGDDRLASVTGALGAATWRSYDAISRLQSVTNAAGNSITYGYDSLNRPISAVDASGKAFSFGWDREARLISVTDALSRTVTFTRDARGLATAVTSANNEKYASTYDALGRLTSTTDPLGRAAQFRYDGRGLVVGVTLPAGIGAAFSRNELGRITTLTDPNGSAWQRGFDKMGRLISISDPLGRTSSIAYDSRQGPSKITLPLGSVQLGYDPAGNLVALSYSDGPILSFNYDANNRFTGASGVTLSYDNAGRITGSNGLQIARDSAGRITAVTWPPGKTVQYAYDIRGLLSSVTDWVGGSTAFAYDDAGQLTSVTFPNGVREDYTYDLNGAFATINVSAGGAAISSIALQRDAAGQVVNADRSAPTIPPVPAGELNLSYDVAHQSTGATYDALGRVNSDGFRNYTWGVRSRLLSYDGADGGASFTYDALGQRISRTAGGLKETYALNYALALPSVSVVRSDSGDQRYYVWLPSGALLYSIEAADNTRHFYHFDEMGSVNFLTDDSGAVTDTYAITPYGETVVQTGSTANPFTFQGRYGAMQEGSTGLYYMRARYYDSVTARFLSRDPAGSLDPRELNPYQFALDNPMRFIDPAGLQQIPGGQQAFTCTANAGAPVIVRVEGITELVGDLLLQCTGGKPVPGGLSNPIANFQLTLNTNITSRPIGGAGNTDALLLIDEPTSNPTLPAQVAPGFNPVSLAFNQPSPAVISTTPLPNLIFNSNNVAGFYQPMAATPLAQAALPLTLGVPGSAIAPFNAQSVITGLGGTIAAVYEVVNSDPSAIEQANIPIGVAFISNTTQNLPPPGQSIVNQSFAPIPQAYQVGK